MQNHGRVRKTEQARRKHAAERDGRVLFILIGIAVILLLLILIVLRRNQVKKAEEESIALEMSIAESRSVAESIEASVAESLANNSSLLMEVSGGEVYDVVQKYFALRQAGDAEGLYELYGKDLSKGVDEEYAAMLEAQSAWIRSFDDIQVTVIPGKNEDERIGVVKYKINFRRVSAKAPCIMYFYLVKDEEGNWEPKDNLLKETREYIQQVLDEYDITSMIEENTAELRKILEEDSDLALMYTSFLNGEIYSDYNLDPDREQEIDLFTDPEDSILLGE